MKQSAQKFAIVTGVLLFAALGLLASAPAARAAVPVWVVGFDKNTEFEISLETFTKDLFQNIFGQTVALQGQISARQETFQQAYDLAKIMKAREDVNKLVFEAFSELRSEPLLLEFQQIRQACADQTEQPVHLGPTPSGAAIDAGFQHGQCLFYTQVEDYLRSRGLEIVSKPFQIGYGYGTSAASNKAAVENAIKNGDDPLCLYGVRTNDGECITIKLEGRIITNPDDFLFEEPIQKARDFLYCYFGPWRHFPWAVKQEDADTKRDNMRNMFLLSIARKLKFTQTAPPPEWYTEARCQVILASLQCPLASEPQQAMDSSAIPKDNSSFPVLNRDVACIARDLADSPTLKQPLDAGAWGMKDLHDAITQPENTENQTKSKVDLVIKSIISDYQQERNAEYIAGQGIRPEKYLIGYRAYKGEKDANGNYKPDSEYGKLVAEWTKGKTMEGLSGIDNPSGDWYYFDTENIISPAIILLDKINAATQAEFNLAQAAFQAPKVPDNKADDIALSGPGPCEKTPPPTLNRLEYVCREVPSPIKAINGIPIDLTFHYWSTKPTQPSDDNYTTGYYTSQDSSSNARALSAPWEDPNVKLPDKYLTGQAPQSKDENPDLSFNYFNQWYKDILELHKWHFSAIVQQWFKKPEKSFFVPDR